MAHNPHVTAWLKSRVVDVSLAVATFVAMGLVGALFPTDGAFRTFDLWSYLLTALISLPLAATRTAPMVVLVVVSAADAVFVVTGHLPGLHLWATVLAFYSLAAQRPPRVTAVGAVLAAVDGYFCAQALHTPLIATIAQVPTAVALAWWLGNVARQLDQRNHQLAEATVRLRQQQQEHLKRVLTQERLRIARELHDVVAHHMSVISLQAGLADYVFDTKPATAREAVHTIGTTSREALDEMRRLLNLLRVSDHPEDPENPEPVPRLGDLATLVERARVAGVETDLDLDADLGDLPSGLQLTVYRIVQEAVTNMIKHAGPCNAEIVVRRQQKQLNATISNDTRAISETPVPGSGYGLMGMRERARLYQGTVTAGPRPDGRYTVELTVPLP